MTRVGDESGNAKAPLARGAEDMERRAAHGPGARNRMLPCFRRQGACVIFGPVAWRRPGRFTRAPGGTVSSAGGRAPGCLCARLRLSRFDSISQSLGPRRARRPETPRTPGFRPGQSRSTGPRRRFSAWVPRRLSCDGDGQRVAHRCTWSGRTVRETVGALKGLGNLRAAIALSVSSLAKLERWIGCEAAETEGLLRACLWWRTPPPPRGPSPHHGGEETEKLPSQEAAQPSIGPEGDSRRGMARMAWTRARARPAGVGSMAAMWSRRRRTLAREA